MKRRSFGRIIAPMFAMASVVIAGFVVGHAAFAAQNISNSGNDPDPMKGYYGNTYVCYWPTWWECHHWWNEDGSEIYFSGKWAPEGIVSMTTIDGRYRVFSANAQWCATNARTVAPTRARDPDNPNPPPPSPESGPAGAHPDSLDNNENGCAPVVDAVPGNKWFKLHKGDNQFYNFREEYVLMPGHQ